MKLKTLQRYGGLVGDISGPLPPPPTRDQILGLDGLRRFSFQGLVVPTFDRPGPLPGFEACLPWLSSRDRQSYYTTKHAAGDTHALVHLPCGPALYDEPNQPYNATDFPPLDWTNGGTKLDDRFPALLKEVIANGFNSIALMLGGDGPDNQPIAMRHLDLLHECPAYNDTLWRYCVPFPGYDGVFYGWEPTTKITDFGAKFRTYWRQGHLGLWHGAGHIPLGEGGDDYLPGGRLQDFDLIASEYDNDLHQDSCWQINGRMVREYIRPADQTPGDDPAPPYYLREPNVRGPWGHWAIEYGEFEYVRSGCSQGSVDYVHQNRSYQRGMNCQFTG